MARKLKLAQRQPRPITRNGPGSWCATRHQAFKRTWVGKKIVSTWAEKIFIVDHNQTVMCHLRRIKTPEPNSPLTLALICLRQPETQRVRETWQQ
jgi:hypothetical protein